MATPGLRMRTKHARRRAVRIWCTASARGLPDHAIGRDQEQARVLVEALTGRAIARLAGGGGVRLDAPEGPVRTAWAALRGKGICRPRRGEIYATRAQGAVDGTAGYSPDAGAPHLSRQDAARLHGAWRS